jgi:predicted TIM-barrel fold metal-dependent hydrolase
MHHILLKISMLLFALPLAADPIGDGVDDLPLFDAHVHYNTDAWEPYPPATVIELMDNAGVTMALVSSTPDEGTIKLYKFAPNRIVPEVRPYHGGWGASNWMRSPDMIEYITERLASYPHAGIGEFHVHSVGSKDEPMLIEIAKLAARENVLVHIHSEHEPVESVYQVEPDLRVIWAHAGMSSPPEVIERMMDIYPTLYADLSYREHEILGADGIEPEWEQLLTKHSDRFMIGSDTWANDQWKNYKGLIVDNRRWLRHFPRELAEKFAFKNAEQLFGVKVSKEQLGTR